MWRGVFDSARNRGGGPSRGEGIADGTSRSFGQESMMKPSPEEGARPPTGAPNVSRETWTPPRDSSWVDPTAADTPIGAEAERAVRVLHGAKGRPLPRPRRQRVFTI